MLGEIMDKNQRRVYDLMIGMWANNIEEENGSEPFQGWCVENTENEQQERLIALIAPHVDFITETLANW